MVLVDSSVWTEAARRRGDLATKMALRVLLDEYEAAWCSPVKLEVMGGARREERRALGMFFRRHPVCRVRRGGVGCGQGARATRGTLCRGMIF